MHKVNLSQSGRSMLEMLAVVCLMALISIGVFYIYNVATDKTEFYILNQEMNTRLVQLRHQALTSKGIEEETEEQALSRAQSNQSASSLPIRIAESGENEFILIVGANAYPLEEPLCQKVIKSYQGNNQQCFISGSCNGTTGEFKFSKQCNLQNYPENSDFNCGQNAHKTAFGCECNKGYTNWKEGVGCSLIELDCGAHAYQSGITCVCDKVYENWTKNDGCSLIQLDCDQNAYQDETLCKCNAGYYGNGITCSLCQDRQYSSENSFSCSICPAGKTHNSSHTGCQNCTASMTLGGCGCASTKVPDGNGGCKLPCTSYANTSTTVREGYKITGTPCYCVSGYTLNTTKTACEIENTCSPGPCMTCSNGTIEFKSSGSTCEQAGIAGTCTSDGLCSPSGTYCSSITGCSSGYFCNYDGERTPYICEKVTPQTTTINGVTYYYNTLSDLKSWCQPADGGKNCTWGYLSRNGASSWCQSIGKRLLTLAEFQNVRSVLSPILPSATNNYWYDNGWFNKETGSYGSRLDGYAANGGVVCR